MKKKAEVFDFWFIKHCFQEVLEGGIYCGGDSLNTGSNK